MGKIIKKGARKSLPIFIILCLVSLTVTSIYFNIDFDFVKLNQKKSFIEIGNEALASVDTASTTVTVRNEAPSFSANPAESPASYPSNPVNVGGNVTFVATGTDTGADAYWLIVCENDSVATVTAGNPPTCMSGSMFCRSTATSSSGSGSTCTYTGVVDPTPSAETDAWYAYVCDNHPTEPQCSVSSQGSGDSGSPISINHAPVFNAVTTTVNNREPGGTFTITASTTDSDVAGTADELYFYVCSTNSWTVGAGCGGTTLCMGTSTSPDVSCNYTDPGPPTADQAYTYYGFLKDFHDFSGNGGSSNTSTYTIINVSPVISNVTLNSGQNINLNLRGAAEVLVYATSSSVEDRNGCTDILDATSTMYLGTVSNGANCTASNNNCYQVASTNCEITGCSGSTGTVNCTTTFAFYAMPTDTDSPASTTGWMARISVWDEALSTTSSFIATSVDVISTAGLQVTENTIAYGDISPGNNTGTTNSTTTVINYGNTPIDTEVSGTDMDDGGSNLIGIAYQEHSLINFAWGTGTDTSSTTPNLLDTVVSRPTSASDFFDEIYWGMGVPPATPSGAYSGTNTFTVVEDPDGNWSYP